MPAGQGRGGGGAPRAGRRRFGGARRPPADPSSAEAARGRAISLLARRDYASRALQGRLTEAGFEPAAAATAVADLEDERLVSDERYVAAAVASRIARGKGPRRILYELKGLGIAEALARAAVEAHAAGWGERAAELRRRRFGPAAPASAEERARQVRFLLYRGFCGEQVRAAVGCGDGEALEDLESPEDAGASGDEPDLD